MTEEFQNNVLKYVPKQLVLVYPDGPRFYDGKYFLWYIDDQNKRVIIWRKFDHKVEKIYVSGNLAIEEHYEAEINER